MANMKDAAAPKSAPSVQAGTCSATAAPGGESPEQVSARADRVVKRARAIQGNVLLFTSGHFIRVLACPVAGDPAHSQQQIFHVEYGEPQRPGL